MFVAPYGFAFKDLHYDDFTIETPGGPISVPGRYTIFYLMDHPEILIAPPFNLSEETAMQIKSLLNFILILGNYIYYSEYCNIVPSGFPGGMPVYERIVVGTDPDTGRPIYAWPIIPGSAWDQMEYELDGEVKKYPGPIVSETNYQSNYTGLKVKIQNNGVVFEG